MITNTDHVVMRHNQFTCEHCGGTFQVTFPVPIKELCQKTDAFIALHKNCKAPQETILAKRFDTEGMGRL